MGLSISFVVQRAEQTLGRYEFDSDQIRTIKIGRLGTAQIKLEDAKVSRIHAIIELGGGEATVVDMGSVQGTLVAGKKVSRAKLAHGDVITVGETNLHVSLGAASTQPPAPANIGPQAITKAPPPAAFLPPAAPPLSAAPLPPAAPPLSAAPPPPAAPPAPPSPERVPEKSPGPSGVPGRRITQARLNEAISTGYDHPSLVAEDPRSLNNRVLELRLYWGDMLLGMYHYFRPKMVTIGENKKTHLFLSSEGLPKEAFPLIRYRDNEYILSFTDRMAGEIEMAGQHATLAQTKGSWASDDDKLPGTYQLALGEDARALLHWGGATLAMRFVAPAKMVPAAFGAGVDTTTVTALMLSFILHMVMVVTLIVYPRDTEALKVDLFGEPDRFAQMILDPPKQTAATKNMLDKIEAQVNRKREQIKPPPRQPVAKDAKIADTKSVTSKQVPHPQKTAEEKKADVAKRFSSLLGGGVGKGGGAGSILGGGGGGSLAGTLQNVIGTSGVGSASAGMAGLGVRGAGPMTGGGLGQSRGIAGIGTTGRLGGGGIGYGGGVGLGASKSRDPIELETPTIEGALSADVIKRVIKQNINQARYCYEVELQRNQNLEGRVLVHWVIGSTGSVIDVKIKESSIHNSNVENCLMAKIRTWKFPAPAGGGTVEVNYPFVFKVS